MYEMDYYNLIYLTDNELWMNVNQMTILMPECIPHSAVILAKQLPQFLNRGFSAYMC